VIKKLLAVVGFGLLLALGVTVPAVAAGGSEPACTVLNCW
jgi:hypothetical protein